jgi:low temperature requirement protein LtrA
MPEAAQPGRQIDPDEVRVSTLELFFDLVFVFTVTQLTASLVHHPDGTGLGQVALMLTAIWWMYGAFAWLTNAVPPDRTGRRIPLLAGMAAFFVISLTIPTAFSGDGVPFACAYLAVIVIHGALYTQSAAWSLASVWSFTRMNLLAGALILAGAIIGGDWQYVLWGLVIVPFLITPAMVPEDSGWLRPSHFVERHGLVIIVALGESVVAVGIGASGLEVTAELLLVAVLGLAVSAALWWVYFGRDDDEAREALLAMQPTKREFIATNAAYYWAHLLLLLGIVSDAAGLEEAIAHPFDRLDFAFALALGGGTALYLCGHALFRLFLGLPFKPWRGLTAVLALATIPLGTEASALAQLTALAAALGLCVVAEALTGRGEAGVAPAQEPLRS